MAITDRAQIYLIPPTGETHPVIVDLQSTTLKDLCQSQLNTKLNHHSNEIQFSSNGHQFYDSELTLAKLGIGPEDVIRTSGRLRGGAMLKLKIKTKFGCTCCANHCSWDCFCTGRVDEIEVNSIRPVNAIYEALGELNPKMKDKNHKGNLITENGTVLENHKKILFYDLRNGSELWLQMSPMHMFYSSYWSGGTVQRQEEEEEEEEIRKAVAAKKEEAAAKKKAAEQNEGIEDIELA